MVVQFFVDSIFIILFDVIFLQFELATEDEDTSHLLWRVSHFREEWKLFDKCIDWGCPLTGHYHG